MSSRLISGVISLALLVTLGACRFPYSLSGGGLDPKLRTVAILPFENRTNTPGIERELSEQMANEVRGKLGLKEAPESRAHVLVSGAVSRYEADIPVGFSADRTRATGTRRRLQIAVEVSVRDVQSGKSLLERRSFPADAEYAEGAETGGRRDAIVKVVNDMIQALQSPW